MDILNQKDTKMHFQVVEFKKQTAQRVFEKIRVAVVWDGRGDAADSREWDTAVESNTAYPMSKVRDYINENEKMNPHGPEVQQAQRAKVQIKKLEKAVMDRIEPRIKELAKVKEALADKDFPQPMVDRIAKEIEQQLKQDCILPAPDLWGPG